MPIIYKQEHSETTIAVWESVEDSEFLFNKAGLSADEIALYRNFKSESRKREFLTVRALLRQLFPQKELLISYSSNGKPSLNNGEGISISHTKNFVGIMTGRFRKCGIDLETIDERIFRLSTKFMNEKETGLFGNHLSAEQLQIIWGAKEVLYKIHEIGDVDFRKHLNVDFFEAKKTGHLNAEIVKTGYEKKYDIYYENFAPLMITWAKE
jgi:4'-phosphopantetheinyl transferase